MAKKVRLQKLQVEVDDFILKTFLDSESNREAMIQMREENHDEDRETAERVIEMGMMDQLIVARIRTVLESNKPDRGIKYAIERIVVDDMGKADPKTFFQERLGAFTMVKSIS